MIKGKTEIILTDVNTGESQKVFEHNTVTNALNLILKQYGYIKNSDRFLDGGSESIVYNGNFRPFYKNLLGGLLLFDKAIDANNGNTIFAPNDVNLIGCGAYNQQGGTDEKVFGNYNASESYYNSQEKSMKYVYDFPTSRANGTINSICLTSINGGYVSYGHSNGFSSTPVSGFRQISDYKGVYYIRSDAMLFAIDLANNSAYYLKANSKTDISILKYFIGFSKISIFDGLNAMHLLEEKHYTVNLAGTFLTLNYSEKTNSVYLLGYERSELSPDASINLFKISLDDDSVEQYVFKNSTANNIRLDLCTFSSSAFYVETPNNQYQIYQAKYDDISTIIDTNYSFGNFSKVGCYEINGSDYLYVRRCQSVNNYKVGRALSNGTVIPTGFHTDAFDMDIIPVIGTNQLMFYNHGSDTYSNGWNFFLMPMNYLATINNLSAPVTKTDTQTMKVIYTITESDAS